MRRGLVGSKAYVLWVCRCVHSARPQTNKHCCIDHHVAHAGTAKESLDRLQPFPLKPFRRSGAPLLYRATKLFAIWKSWLVRKGSLGACSVGAGWERETTHGRQRWTGVTAGAVETMVPVMVEEQVVIALRTIGESILISHVRNQLCAGSSRAFCG